MSGLDNTDRPPKYYLFKMPCNRIFETNGREVFCDAPTAASSTPVGDTWDIKTYEEALDVASALAEEEGYSVIGGSSILGGSVSYTRVTVMRLAENSQGLPECKVCGTVNSIPEGFTLSDQS